MDNTDTIRQITSILILGLTPEILEKPVLWFSQHETEIREALATQAHWASRAALITQGKKLPPFALLRKLDELGYEKVLEVTRYGEFSHRGGIVDVFPINAEHPVRIAFDSNFVEALQELSPVSDIQRKDWVKVQKRAVLGRELANLSPGDYLVHLDHGIGRYHGRDKIQVTGGELEDYIVIEYAEGDKLFVPEDLARRKVSRYFGFRTPTVHRLGGLGWLTTKRKAREDAELFARELLATYAHRTIVHRPPYPIDHTVLTDFAATFGYQETPDQLRALADIERDLSGTIPLDRLIAGDVGFGKTEVALRTAVLVAAAGKQTAILAPTTVLAEQHHITAKTRFEKLGMRVEMLTRLQTKAGQRKVLEGLSAGTIDLVVGTHRILSHDVTFKDLGLLIIDEEQRFGVRHKEALKKLRAELNVLTLTATPIPRTLSFAISGVRPVSRIDIPPPGRQDIETFVAPWTDTMVRAAIAHELSRKGQIYFLHNHIGTMHKTVLELQKFAPQARIDAIHGRMNETKLSQVMADLRAEKIDILVATTIIENGLDLANVNTLVVEESSRLGLADAYQLRGRIGRRERKGYAYFLWRDTKPRGKAKERLEALQETTAVGSGWQIAMRDLEIRGAGNILGREQSGVANRIGFNLYFHLLSEAVEKLRSEELPRHALGTS